MKPKMFFARVKSINEADRTIDAVASTPDIDRDNDRILPSAFAEMINSFKANPVILAAHRHRLDSGSSPVIGHAIPESIAITDNAMTFTMQFAVTAMGEEYWILYRDNHMKAFSVGFIPIEYVYERDEKLGSIRTYTKVELLEISAVPVPSNRAALVRTKGFYEYAESDEFEKLKTSMAELSEKFEALQIEHEDFKILLDVDRGEFAEALMLGEGHDLLADRGGGKAEKTLEQILDGAIKVLKMKG